MKLLAFDTCLDKTYVTLYNGENFVNKVILSNEKNYHSAYLISTIIEILKSESLEPKDLDYISTDIGPGSFTGIRACIKNLPASARDTRDEGSIPGSGRSPGGENSNLLQYSCLENSMHGGSW